MTALHLARTLRNRPWLAYGAGVLLAAAGLVLRLLLLGDSRGYPFVSFLPAVFLTAFIAGLGPALICSLCSAAIGVAFFVATGTTPTLGSNPALTVGLFLFIALFAAIMIDVAIRAYLRLEELQAERRAELQRQIDTRTAERDRLWSLSQDPFVIADRAGVWLAASPAWERILGWPLQDILGHASGGILHPEDREKTQREREFVFGGGTSIRFQNRYRARDGNYRWFSWNAVAEGDRLYAVVRDVTAIRETARQLEQTQEALVQSQKIEAMGKVTGGVAHDFNNLLTPILGGLDILQRRGLPDSRAERLVDGALQAAERARTLVQRLLAFARRQPLQIVPVDLGRLVESLRELIESTLGPRISLTIDLPHRLPHVRADAAQLEMALLNLAVNARDATPDGGSLAIAAATMRVDGDDGLPAGAYVRLGISDSGIGMTPQVMERAIEPFYSTKGVGRGTGLGLSMVHGLMGQLGGALRIESAPGEGTHIHLWLPVAGERQSAGERHDSGSAVARAAGAALLVDDEELVRASVGAMLSDLGYDVTEADSAARALELIDGQSRFDLIVTDHLMPGMTGTELAAEVKRRDPGQRLVIISGYSELDEIAPGLPRLAKPFKQEELAEAIGA